MVSSAFAAKTDVVVLINGDSVTGEVKSLEFGVLRYSTDSMGTVEIDWEDVVSLTSDQSLQVEVMAGTRYFGGLQQPDAPGMIRVGRGDFVEDLAKDRVVRMTPIDTDERLLERFDGSFSFGFNTDKGSQVTKNNIAADFRYRTREYLVGLNLSSSITDQPGAETTQRQNLSFNYQRFRDNRWFTNWSLTGDKNDEQGINARFSGSIGLGRYLVQTNKDQFAVIGGLAVTYEDVTGDAPDTTFGEGLMSLQYRHRMPDPEASVNFSLNAYPLLKDLRSFRSDADLSYRKEFITDLFFDLSVYYTFLSDPPDGSEKDDYGVVTSIGYSF
jgi:hypothetical protein